MRNIIQFKPKPLSRRELEYKWFCEMRDRDMKRREQEWEHHCLLMKIHVIGAITCLLIGITPLVLILMGVRP